MHQPSTNPLTIQRPSLGLSSNDDASRISRFRGSFSHLYLLTSHQIIHTPGPALEQERFPKPLSVQCLLYLSQKGWRQVPDGWVHDEFRCDGCGQDDKSCIVSWISPIENSRGGFRLSTCNECRRKDVACDLVSAVVRTRYHWDGNVWERAVLGIRYKLDDPWDEVVDEHDGGDLPRPASSASTIQLFGGRLLGPTVQWIERQNARLDRPGRGSRSYGQIVSDPKYSSYGHGNNSPSNESNHIALTLPASSSNASYDSWGHRPFETQNEAPQSERSLSESPPVHGVNEEDHPSWVYNDPRFKDNDDAIQIDQPLQIIRDDQFETHGQDPVPYDAHLNDMDDAIRVDRMPQSAQHNADFTRDGAPLPASVFRGQQYAEEPAAQGLSVTQAQKTPASIAPQPR
jgi:hypothetical protein